MSREAGFHHRLTRSFVIDASSSGDWFLGAGSDKRRNRAFGFATSVIDASSSDGSVWYLRAGSGKRRGGALDSSTGDLL